MQSWASIPGRYQSRLAATLFDGLQEVPAGRTPPHGRGVHKNQHMRRMLRFHSLLSRQELSAIAVGKRQRFSVYEIELVLYSVFSVSRGSLCSVRGHPITF